MKQVHAFLPCVAAAVAVLCAAAAAPAWADRGERGERGHRGDRGDSFSRDERGGSGHWRGAIVVRPVVRPHYGVSHHHRGGWVRPIAPYYPRHGLVIHHRPALWTLVTVGALSYLYANGVYYREHDSGGYEVVAPPAEDLPPAADAHFVYPRQGQGADRQASDEYECHRWAVQQTGFDPSSVAMGTARNASAEQRAGYPRARNACLEGRGYSVQ